MNKRIRAFLLAAMMVVSILPIMSMAATDTVKIGAQGYATLQDAVLAAVDGDVITVLSPNMGDVDQAAVDSMSGKAITIDGNGVTLTNGLQIGETRGKYLSNPLPATVNSTASVTIKNFKFTVKGLSVGYVGTVNVENNTFTDITANKNTWGNGYAYPFGILMYWGNTASVTGNKINHAEKSGIIVNNFAASVTVSDNEVKDAYHNAILINDAAAATITVEDNILINWARGSEGGRGIRISTTTSGALSVNNNDMMYDGKVTEDSGNGVYARVSGTAPSTVSLEGNYWNGETTVTAEMLQGIDTGSVGEVSTTYNHYSAPVYGGPVMNWVKVNTAENGVVKSGPLAASEGATITLYPKAAAGYVLDTVEVLDAEGNALELDGMKFKVPLGGVTVNATFKLAE